MPTRVMATVGVVLALVGAVFVRQGIGLSGGSFMSGSGKWAVIGVALIAGGLPSTPEPHARYAPAVSRRR